MLLLLIAFMPWTAWGATDRYRIVAYVAGRSIPAVMHLEKVTHVNFAFAQITPSGQAALADGKVEANLSRLVELKKANPALKVIISIGGWMADGFSDAAFTNASRSRFADSAVQLLRQFSADGIDIDWEYPGQGVAGIKYRAEDRENFTRLLSSLLAAGVISGAFCLKAAGRALQAGNLTSRAQLERGPVENGNARQSPLLRTSHESQLLERHDGSSGGRSSRPENTQPA